MRRAPKWILGPNLFERVNQRINLYVAFHVGGAKLFRQRQYGEEQRRILNDASKVAIHHHRSCEKVAVEDCIVVRHGVPFVRCFGLPSCPLYIRRMSRGSYAEKMQLIHNPPRPRSQPDKASRAEKEQSPSNRCRKHQHERGEGEQGKGAEVVDCAVFHNVSFVWDRTRLLVVEIPESD